MQNDLPDSSRGRFLWFVLGCLAIALLVLAYIAISWGNSAHFQAAIDTCRSPFCDFAGFYYPMGGAVLRSNTPVEGFMYSPFIAISLGLFSQLPIKVASLLWGLLQAGCVALYLLLFRWLIPAGVRYQMLFALIALTSFPLWHNLSWGQVGIMTTIAVLGVVALLERGGRIFAAALAGFAASFKFFPLIFLAPFAFRRDFRFVGLAALACATFFVAIPGVLMGPGDTLSFYRGLLDSFRASDWVVSNYNSQHFPHLILRLAGSARLDLRPYLPLMRLLSFSIATLSLALVYLVQRARLPHADLWGVHLLFLSIPFFLKTSWPVDLVYISFGQAFLIWQVMEGMPHQPGEQRKHLCKGALLALLVTSTGISNLVALQLTGNYRVYGYLGAIFWADLLCLIVSFILLLPIVLESFKNRS